MEVGRQTILAADLPSGAEGKVVGILSDILKAATGRLAWSWEPNVTVVHKQQYLIRLGSEEDEVREETIKALFLVASSHSRRANINAFQGLHPVAVTSGDTDDEIAEQDAR